MAVSIAVAARGHGFADSTAHTAAQSAASANMNRLAGLDGLTVWYELNDLFPA